MYENFDEMKALAEQAKERLQQQVSSDEDYIEEDHVEDLYSEFREDDYYEEQYQEGDHQSQQDVYYGPNPTLDSDGESNPLPYLDPYDEPLFPGGPGKSQIQAWKKEWEGYDLYVTEVLNETFVFRTLNRFEYKQLISLQKIDALQREEIICQTVTLWPDSYTWKEMATSKAGVPSTYSDIIMEKSGFTKDYAIQVI